MATKKLKGLTIQIDGDTTPLNNALTSTNKIINSTASELRQVERLLRLDPTNTELLAQKQTLLANSIEGTSDKLALLKKSAETAMEQLEKGEISEATFRELQREIVKTEESLKKLENSTQDGQERLAKLDEEARNAAQGLEKAAKEAEEAEAALKKIKTASDDALKGVANVGNQIAVGLAAAMVVAVESTEEYRTDLSKLQTNASTAGESMNLLKDEMRDLNAVTGETDSNVEALSNLLETPLRGNQLQEAVDALSGAVISFPDTLKIEGVADGLQETFATGTAMGQFAELLDRTGVNVETFESNLASAKTEAEKVDIVMQALASTGMAAANEAYREQNQQLIDNKNAQFDLNDAIAELGEKAEPILTDLKEVTAEFISWLIDHDEEVLSFVYGLGAGLVTLNAVNTIKGLTSAFSTFSSGLGTATTATQVFNTALKSNVVGIVATAVATLGGALYSYSQRADDAVSYTKVLQGELETLRKDYDSAGTAIDEVTNLQLAEAKTAQVLASEFAKLSEQINSNTLTSEANTEAKGRLNNISDQLKNLIPQFEGVIWSETGALVTQSAEVINLANSYYELAEAKAFTEAYESKMTEAAKQIVEAQSAIDELMSKGTGAAGMDLNDAVAARKLWQEQLDEANELKAQAESDLDDYNKKLEELRADDKEPVIIPAQIEYDNVEYDKDFGVSTSSFEKALQSGYDSAADWINKRSTLNELSVKEEADYWQQIANNYTKYSDEQVDAQSKANSLLASLEDQRTSYASSAATERVEVQEEANEELAQTEAEYLDIIKTSYDEINALNEEYQNQLKDRADEIMNFYGLFDEVQDREKTSSTSLINNLRDQVGELTIWAEQLEQLKSKGVSDELYNQVEGMGVSALSELEALNRMTAEQLTEFSLLFAEKNKIATEKAAEELAPLREQTQSEISEIMRSISDEFGDSEDIAKNMVIRLSNGIVSESDTAIAAAAGLASGINAELAKINTNSFESAVNSDGAEFLKAVNNNTSAVNYATAPAVQNLGTSNVDFYGTVSDVISDAIFAGLLAIDDRIYQLLTDILTQRIAINLDGTTIAELLFGDIEVVAKTQGKIFPTKQYLIDLIKRNTNN